MPDTIIVTLAVITVLIVAFIFYKLGSLITNLSWQKRIPQMQKMTADRQRSTIKGRLVETFAPFLPNFPFKPSECKFIGDPIDYLIFEGLDDRDVKAIHLLEVKDENSKLSKHQRQIKEIIDDLNSEKVSFKEFRFEQE